MVNLVGVWIILFAILFGWGLLVLVALRRFGGCEFYGAIGSFQVVWLGYAALLTFLQLTSLGLRINDLAFAISVVPSLAGYVLSRREIARAVRSVPMRWSRRRSVTAAMVAIITVTIAYAAFDNVALYDTGLYHLQAVKWMTRYPVVKGLANLHMRFGYNNSVHLFGAYVDTLWEGVAVHISNGFLLLLVLSQWIVELFRARTPRGRLRQIFCLFTLPFLVLKIWVGEVPSLSTDLPLALVSCVFILELLSIPSAPRDQIGLPAAVLLALGAIAVVTKLGGLALLVTASVVLLAIGRRQVLKRGFRVAMILPTSLVIGWLIRGVILSGWLIYPVFGRLPVTWAVSKRIAAYDYGNIQSWSRMWKTPPDVIAAHNFWWWFRPWFDGFSASREFTLLCIAIVLLAWRIAHGPFQSAARRAGEWGAIAACLVGMFEWFLGAPDLRYGNFWFWMLPAAVLAPMLSEPLRDRRTRAFVVVLAVAAFNWSGGFALHLRERAPKLWGRPPAPPRMATTLTEVGPHTSAFVPADAAKGEDRCFDEPLPCTPQIGIQVQRDATDLSAGYLPSQP